MQEIKNLIAELTAENSDLTALFLEAFTDNKKEN